jgi:hypothetical protein
MHDPREPHYALIKRICAIYMGHWIMSCSFDARISLLWSPTLMLGPAVLTTVTPPLGMQSFLVIISSLGPRSGNLLYHGPVLRPSIVQLQMLLLRQLGYPATSGITCSPLRATIVYCDNVSAVYLSTNPV